MSNLGDINVDEIMPCELCDGLIAAGRGHIGRIEGVGPNIKGVWYRHIHQSDCDSRWAPLAFGKPFVERESNVIQTEFRTLDVMLRRVRDVNPSSIVIMYDLGGEDEGKTRVSWLGVERVRLVGMLTGAAIDIWNDPEVTVRTVGPGDSG